MLVAPAAHVPWVSQAKPQQLCNPVYQVITVGVGSHAQLHGTDGTTVG